MNEQYRKVLPAMSKQEFANYYNVSLKTFNRWIKKHSNEIGEYEGRKYTPHQVSVIISLLE